MKKQASSKKAKSKVTLDVESNLKPVSKGLGGSHESIDSIDHVQNTVNSNAILLMKSDEEDNDDDCEPNRRP